MVNLFFQWGSIDCDIGFFSSNLLYFEKNWQLDNSGFQTGKARNLHCPNTCASDPVCCNESDLKFHRLAIIVKLVHQVKPMYEND